MVLAYQWLASSLVLKIQRAPLLPPPSFQRAYSSILFPELHLLTSSPSLSQKLLLSAGGDNQNARAQLPIRAGWPRCPKPSSNKRFLDGEGQGHLKACKLCHALQDSEFKMVQIEV